MHLLFPGTLFMDELHKELSKWLEAKVEKDQAWHGIRVYLSGHDVSFPKTFLKIDCNPLLGWICRQDRTGRFVQQKKN